MGKYLSAELYKVTHRRSYALCALVILLGGEALLLFLLKTAGFSNATTYADALSVLSMSLLLGVYLVAVVSDMVFSDQFKQNTLKNEVAYGLPRSRIYLGKLAAAVVTALALCALVLIFYLGVGALVFPLGDLGAVGGQMLVLGKSLAVALPVWLGAMGYAMMLLFVMRGATTATVVFVLTLSLGDILDLTRFIFPKLDSFFKLVQRCLITAPLDNITRGAFEIPYAWAVGMAWLAASTVIGLVVFRKREIN